VALTPSSRIGPYEVLAPLGAGGMGEVFLAKDTRLGREVAIKALPDAFAHDPERLARFEREARLLASLKHPNIAAIYGLEEADGRRYLILEYVPGPTLADRLASGPLPLDETLEVCAQIAAGVEAAHENGVVHRDLKPANVKLTPSGEVKVLDFGLAKSGAGAASSSGLDLSHSPTVANQATTAGMILGTAAYMSPEQARGRPVDRRTDIWSFGCVLYECLTRKPLYEGETVSDLIARILEREPDWSALPAATPVSVRELLRRCLMKDPRERLRDIGEARLTLVHAAAGETTNAPASPPARRRRGPAAWIVIAASLVAAGLLGASVVRLAFVPPSPAMRVSVLAPDDVDVSAEVPDLVISPDGANIVFMGTDTTGVTHLWVRPLASESARMLAGTEDAKLPFWSPDSREIAFFAQGQLKRIALEGNDVVRICAASNPRGGAWGRGGLIVFAPTPAGPLMQISASGGELRAATVLDTAKGETSHRFPSFLPDGRHFFFMTLPGDSDNKLDARVSTPGGAPSAVVCRSPNAPIYTAGWIVYYREGTIVAQRFDAGSLRTRGSPRALHGFFDVSGQYSGSPPVTASDAGILLQRELETPLTHLEFRDRTGRLSSTMDLPPGSWTDPRLSPDGTRLVLSCYVQGDPVAPMWMVDLVRRTTTRFTFDGAFQNAPVWTPDGRRVIYGSDGSHGRNLFWRRADGSGAEELLADVPNLFNDPQQITPDGRTLIYRSLAGETGEDIWEIPLEKGGQPKPLLATKFNEVDPAVSPDGRWLAYRSDESGRMEMYIQSYPGLDRKIRVTRSGASPALNTALTLTRWRSDGRELVFLGGDGQTLMAVDVTPGEDLKLGEPHPLFKLPYGALDIEMTPDGQRVVLSVRTRKSARTVFNLAMNWAPELERQH
jgi:Tol biopolymer transport system component